MTNPTPASLRRRALAAIAVVAAVTLAACGGDDAGSTTTTAGTDSTTAAAAGDETTSSSAAGDIDLSGVKLRFGDTSDDHVRLVFDGSGEGDDLPYEVEWSSFQTGPALIAAQTGGSVDLGKMSETPLVFAQGAGSPVRAVWVGAPIDPATSSLGILVPADSDLQTVADLAGARVGYAPGTVLEYLLSNALTSAGLELDDITPIAIQPGVDLLATGNADAIVTGTSSLSASLLAGTARLLASGAEFTPGYYYLVASESALDDPAVAAAIGDFAQRLARAEEWYNANVDAAVDLVVERNKATPEVARDLITRAPVAYGPITSEVIAAQQAEIDFFVASGVLDGALDAAGAFDQRFGS